MNKQDYDKRIEQYKRALEWFKNASTNDIIKLYFSIVDNTVKTQPEMFARWVKINEDMNEIWHNGTDEQRKKIDEVINNIKRGVE